MTEGGQEGIEACQVLHCRDRIARSRLTAGKRSDNVVAHAGEDPVGFRLHGIFVYGGSQAQHAISRDALPTKRGAESRRWL